MNAIKKYMDGGMGPGKKRPPGTAKGKLDPKCKGPKACYDGGEPDHGKERGPNKSEAGQGPRVNFDNSRMISQKEIERNRRKKEREGMTLGQRVMKNAQEKKNKKAAEAAAKQQRYAGPRFL